MLSHLSLFLNIAPLALAFSFTASSPTQCDNLNLQWTGGTAPFQLLMIPRFDVPRNISIPDSAFSNGTGSYSTPVLFPQGKELIFTMSDSSGFGSGGSTGILTVGSSLGGSCNTSAKVDFTYDTPNPLQQCNPFVFDTYSGAVQPVTIMGVIPGGDSFVLKPPTGSSSYTWTADVYNGTQVVFVMVDSLARQGGSSDFVTVLASGDTSCINGNSPSSTIGPTASSSTPSPTNSASSPTATSSNGTPMPVITATVIGALIFLAVFVTLGLFFLKRYRDRKKVWNPSNFRRDSYRIRSQTDLTSARSEFGNESLSTPHLYPSHTSNPGSTSAYPLFSPFTQSDSQSLSYAESISRNETGNESLSTPYLYPSHTSNPGSTSAYPLFSSFTQSDSQSLSYAQSISQPSSDPFSPIDASMEPNPFKVPESSTMSSAQRKAVMAGAISYKPSRFILHTDIEDAVPPDTGEEVVELPPQYSERRS